MKAWHITDWEKYYEVNSDGGRWQAGQKKRAKPPEYIRWYVGSPGGDDRAYHECALAVAEKFGPEAWAVAFALFGKLLEIAATQDTEFRGYVLGKNHSPISTKLLGFVTGFTMEQVELGIKILSDATVGWLEQRNLPNLSAGLADTPGDSPTLQEAKAKTKSKGKEEAKGESEGQANPPGRQAAGTGSPSPLPSLHSSPSLRPDDAASGEALRPFLPSRFAANICVALRLGNGDRKQRQADLRDFERAANHILAGRLGARVKAIGESCMTRAWEIGTDANIQNKAGYWLTWFKARLEENGHAWD